MANWEAIKVERFILKAGTQIFPVHGEKCQASSAFIFCGYAYLAGSIDLTYRQGSPATSWG